MRTFLFVFLFSAICFGKVITKTDILSLSEFATAPAQPSSGFGLLYVKSDSKIYFKNDGGTEYSLASIQYASASASRSTSQSIADTVTATLIFPTTAWDTASGYNSSTGEYTVQRAGKYRIKAAWLLDIGSYADGNFAYMSAQKNGGSDKMMDRMQAAGANVYRQLKGDAVFNCNVNDVLRVRLWNNTGVSRSNYADAAYNYLEIDRLGD